MSKVKSKSVKDTKSTDPLSKVKGGAIVKPAKSDKAKSKDVAKQVALKENKKSKKVKEPTPEPSSEEESGYSSSESESSESESESEVETKKPVPNGKKVKPASDSESSDDSEGDSDDSDESDVAVELPKANGAKLAAESDASSDESDDSDDSQVDTKVAATAESSDGSSSESESEDERPAKKAAAKKIEKPAKAEAKDDDEFDTADEDSEDSDDSAASEEEKEVKPQSTKRKAAEEEAPTAKKTKTDVDTSRGANLFVGNLSWNVDEAWLQEEFSTFGEISAVRLMTDRATGRSKGFGYVEFVDAEDAAKAHAAKQGAELDGRALNVDFANAKPTQSQAQDNRRKSYGDQTSQPSETLFVGNLSFNVGQEAVSEAFAPHGTILGVRLPTDRETGEPKGFGYVTFASTEEAQVALEAMQGFYLENRPIRLDYSAPRPANGDSPARGGRGGGRGFGGGRGGDRGGFGGRGGRGGGRGDFRGGRGGPRGGRGGSTNRGGFGDFSGRKTTF